MSLSHYRDADQHEVDIVASTPGGAVVGIEVKAGVDINDRDLRHLGYLRDRLGDRFVNGVIVHNGARMIALGDRITAVPVNALWIAETRHSGGRH